MSCNLFNIGEVATDSIINETFKISVVNLIILLTCVLTLIYLFISHVITKRHNRKAKLEVSRIANYVSVGIVILDFDNLRINYANDGFYKMTGFSSDEIDRIYKKNFDLLVKEGELQFIREQLELGSVLNQKLQLKRKNDTFFWIYLTGNVSVRKGKREIYCVLMNVDEVVKNEEATKFNEDRYRIASEIASDILFEYDIRNDQMIFSERYYSMFGTSEVIDNYIEFLQNSKAIYKTDQQRVEDLIEQIRYETVVQGEFRMLDISGNYVWVQLKGRKVKGKDGRYKKIYGKLININNIKTEISKLKQRSEIDGLTGLYNKTSIKKIVENIVSNKEEFTLMIIDIDNFKKVNDTLGHQYGDKVLSDVAKKLKTNIEGFTFGRIGGDEFMGVSKVSERLKIEQISKKINDIIRETYENEGKICEVSASLGIAIKNPSSYEEIFKNADDALYKTKQNGKNSYTIY